MASSVVGALRVDLGINSAQFTTGLKNAQSGLDKFAANAKIGFAAIATAAAGLGAALATAVKSTINEADKLGKMAQSIGIPVEELSRLKHAADLSGVSMEGLGTSVNRLSRNMSEIAGGKTNQAAQAFDALGISVKAADGSLKGTSQIMSEVAAKFATFKDGPEKSALAMAIFGRQGAQLIPLLNQGADGLEKMKDEAERLGIVIDSNTARASEEFNDNLTRLGAVFKGLITQITAQLAPALSALSSELVNLISLNAVGWAQKVVEALNWIVDVGARVALTFRRMGEEFSALIQMATAKDWAGVVEGWNRLKNAGEDYHKSLQGVTSQVSGFWQRMREGVDGTADSIVGLGTKANAPLMATAEGIGKANKEAEKFQKTVDGMAKKVYEATETALEKFNREMAKINFLMQVGAIDAATYARAVKKLQDDLSGLNEANKAAHAAFGSAFADAITGAKSLRNVLGGLINDLKRIAANLLFRQLFGTGTGGNFGMFGDLFGGARALGGPVAGGRTYLVGERGPELFTAPANGQIVPNNELRRGGGLTYAPVIDMRGADQAAVARMEMVLREHSRQLANHQRGMLSAQHFSSTGVLR